MGLNLNKNMSSSRKSVGHQSRCNCLENWQSQITRIDERTSDVFRVPIPHEDIGSQGSVCMCIEVSGRTWFVKELLVTLFDGTMNTSVTSTISRTILLSFGRLRGWIVYRSYPLHQAANQELVVGYTRMLYQSCSVSLFLPRGQNLR